MNLYETQKSPLVLSLTHKAALLLIVSVLFWSLGAPTFFRAAHAAQLTLVSATLNDSAPAHLATTTIRWTTATSTTAGQTIKITLDPVTSRFAQVYSAATTTDFTATGMTIVADAAGCTGAASEVYPSWGNYNTGTDEHLLLTVCATDTVGSGAKVLTIGAAGTKLLYNPSIVGSYRITIGGSWLDTGETRVMILDNVVVTASVDTSFTFTVAGLASGSTVNGTTTSTTTTSTAIAYGTLAPGVPVSGGQELTVATNASNGFVVTVVENQNLLSSTGADIDLFIDGATTSVPVVWVGPLATLDAEATYGHMGLTSDDSDLNGGEFVGTKFAGNFNAPRQVFSHTGPSDGTTQDKGKARVAYEVQVSALQEAGTDYTNTLTYVATPTF